MMTTRQDYWTTWQEIRKTNELWNPGCRQTCSSRVTKIWWCQSWLPTPLTPAPRHRHISSFTHTVHKNIGAR